MDRDLTRRQMMGRTGIVLGGAVGLGLLQGCSNAKAAPAAASNDGNSGADTTAGSDAGTGDSGTTPAGPQVANFPYEQYLPAGYRLDAAAVKEAAYHGYYAGGCCHGAYSALVGHLASTAGAPFNLLPLDFGKFGGGGIASYGSICGAVLGGVLVINMVVANTNARNAMMTDLMRWYEGFAFPAYVPAAKDAGETGLTLDFSPSNLARLQVVPASHLCHASVSAWCGSNHVSASGNDKKARCSRLTGDVAGKVAEMINSYLSAPAYSGAPIDSVSNGCLGCHGAATTGNPVASGMKCAPCHTDKVSNHP